MARKNKADTRKYKREYDRKPEVKAKRRAYQKDYYARPEVTAYQRAYQKEYNAKPEVIAARRAYRKAHVWNVAQHMEEHNARFLAGRHLQNAWETRMEP